MACSIFSNLRVVFLLARFAVAADFNELFTYYDRAGTGGCATYLANGVLDNWHQEMADIVTSAVDALGKYTTEERVQEAVLTYFGLVPNQAGNAAEDQTSFEDVYGLFAQVQSFLDGQKSTKPYLFCDSTYLVQKDPMDQAQDDECDPAEAGDEPALIRDDYNLELTGGDVPWFSQDMCAYIFDPSSGGSRYCVNGQAEDLFGVTMDTSQNSLEAAQGPTVITLCPLAFTTAKSQDTPRSATITSGTQLQSVQSKSLTLLHEIFHALFGQTYFDSGKDEHYGVADCIKRAKGDFAGKSALRNPDSFAYFALSMFYLMDGDETDGTQHNKWDFATGKAQSV